MATALEISITRFRSTGWFAQAVSQGAPILKESYDSARHVVSSSYDGRAMMSQAQTAILATSHVQSGSFASTPQSNAVRDMTISVLSGSATMLSGSFRSTPQSSGIYEVPTEDHNKSRMTSDNPMANQSVSTVEWNFFPIPEPSVEAPTGKPRDLTRYQKAYSFTRQQPVRIRVIRR